MSTTPTEVPRLGLIGDCHAAALFRVARARRIGVVGGPIGNGAALEQEFFSVVDGAFVPHDRSRPVDLSELFRCGLPVLSTVGSNAQRPAILLHGNYYNRPHRDHNALSDGLLRQLIEDLRPGPLHFYRTAAALGCEVHVVHSPQRFDESWRLLAVRLERIFLEMVVETGARLVDVRTETTDAEGRLRPEFFTDREGDLTHANDRWAAVVLDRFLESIGEHGRAA